MASNAALSNLYKTESVGTMSPGRAIVALYDRLLLDLERAQYSIAAGDHSKAHHALVHAQEIVDELHDALDVESWAPGAALAALYRYLHSELITANLSKDPGRIDACVQIVKPLRDAWHEAAGIAGAETGTGESRA